MSKGRVHKTFISDMTNSKQITIIYILVAVGIAAVSVLYNAIVPSSSEKELASGPINGALSFALAASDYQQGEVFPVDVIADSGGQPIVGADVMIQYDPTVLEISEKNGNFVAVEGFSVVYPAEGQNVGGVFQFSLLSQTPKVLSGKVATVYFLAKNTGETRLNFIFQRGKTNDSNLALSGGDRDVLGAVGEAVLQIIR